MNERKVEKVQFFTQHALMGFVKYYSLVFSLAESSNTGVDILQRLLSEKDLSLLMRLSVVASCPIQSQI